MPPPSAAAGPLEGAILALETSGVIGSTAVASEGEVLARRFLTSPGRTATDLVPAVEALLGEAGLAVESLTGILTGAGPGSFTGVRIAASTAKGLASALGIPLLAGSSLAAAAVSPEALASVPDLPEAWVHRGPGGPWGVGPFEEERRPRYVLFDARRGRVYGACFAVGGDDPPSVLIEPHGGTVVDVLNGRPPLGSLFMGDGARVHEGLIRAAGFVVQPLPAGVATADGLLAWGSAQAVDGVWEPDYVRSWTPGR